MTLLLMLLACDLEYSPGGILVGNPGEITLDTAPSEGLTWRRASLPLDTLTLTDCAGGAPQIVTDGGALDLLGGERLGLPEGDWCALTVTPRGPAIWEGVADDGWSLRLELALEPLRATSRWSFATDGASLLLVVGAADALDPDALAPEPGADAVVVDIDHPAYDDALLALTDELTLYDVTGLQGDPGADDVVASDDCGSCEDTGDTACEPCGEPPQSEEASCSGGCGTRYELQPERALLLPVLCLLFGWRRRRGRSARLDRG